MLTMISIHRDQHKISESLYAQAEANSKNKRTETNKNQAQAASIALNDAIVDNILTIDRCLDST